MEEALRALLVGATSVTALVGTRINWGAHPQGDPWPGLVLNLVSGADGMTMQGPDHLNMGRVQIDCYADSYGEAKTVSRAVIDALNGYRGAGFRGVFHASTRDSREGGTNEPDRPYRVSLDFMVNWRATT